jgi:hypothetical protein
MERAPQASTSNISQRVVPDYDITNEGNNDHWKTQSFGLVNGHDLHLLWDRLQQGHSNHFVCVPIAPKMLMLFFSQIH